MRVLVLALLLLISAPLAGADDAQSLRAFQGHTAPVTCVAFVKDSTVLASSSADGTVRLWTVETGQQRAVLEADGVGLVFGISISTDGTMLASANNDGTIRVWDIVTAKTAISWKAHKRGVTAVAFMPGEYNLASGGWDKTVNLWDARTGKLHRTIPAHDSYVTSLAFAPDGKTLASASEDGKVKLWDAASGRQKSILAGREGGEIEVDFHPNGEILASYGRIGLTLWHVRTQRKLSFLEAHTGPVHSMSFSADGKTFATGGGESGRSGEVRIWNVETRELISAIQGQPNVIFSLAFSLDGKLLAAGCADSTVRLWQVASIIGPPVPDDPFLPANSR